MEIQENLLGVGNGKLCIIILNNMIRNKIFLFLLLIFVCQISCTGQKKESTQKKVKSSKIIKKRIMKKFDIKMFNEKQSNGKFVSERNDSIVELIDDGNCFREIIRKKNENFEYYSEYDKNNHQIVKEGKMFSKFPFGKHKTYNDKGEIVKEEDYDKDYPFSIDDLILKMKKDFKIDININKEKLSVNRFIKDVDKKPYYRIVYPLDNYSFRLIIVNGVTGDIYEDKISHYVE